jgi:hypothetical protein
MTKILLEVLRGMGNKDFAKPSNFFAVLPIALIGGIQIGENTLNPYVAFLYFLANAVGLVACIIAAVIIWKFQTNSERSLSVIQVFVVAVAIGILKASVTGLLVTVLSLENTVEEAIISRLPGATVVSVFIFFSISFLASLQRHFGHNRGLLISSRVSRKQKAFLTQRIHALAELVRDIRKQVTNSKSHIEASTLLVDLLEKKIRPLSRELWWREEKQLKDFKSKDLIYRAVFDQKYPSIAMGFILILITPNFVQILAAWDQSSLLLLIQALAFAICFVTLNFLKAIRQKYVLLFFSFLAVSFFSFVISFELPVLFFNEIPHNAIYTMIFLNIFTINAGIIFGSILNLLDSGIRQAGQLREEEGLRSQATYEELDEILIGRELAGLLHGKIQHEILYALSNIEESTDLKAQLQYVEESINQLKEILIETTRPNCESIIDYWKPFLSVVISGAGELSRVQARVIDEAIANAFRHGRASLVSVEILPEDQLIRVTDDGFGPLNGQYGLGSLIFSSLGKWKIDAKPDGGSILEIRENQRNLHRLSSQPNLTARSRTMTITEAEIKTAK